jgi:hypothetical protein
MSIHNRKRLVADGAASSVHDCNIGDAETRWQPDEIQMTSGHTREVADRPTLASDALLFGRMTHEEFVVLAATVRRPVNDTACRSWSPRRC